MVKHLRALVYTAVAVWMAWHGDYGCAAVVQTVALLRFAVACAETRGRA